MVPVPRGGEIGGEADGLPGRLGEAQGRERVQRAGIARERRARQRQDLPAPADHQQCLVVGGQRQTRSLLDRETECFDHRFAAVRRLRGDHLAHALETELLVAGDGRTPREIRP